MTVDDYGAKIRYAFGKAIVKRLNAGATLGAAVNGAYTDVNPNGNTKIQYAIVSGLVGLDLSDVVARLQHREAQQQEAGRNDATKAVTPGDGTPSPEGGDTLA